MSLRVGSNGPTVTAWQAAMVARFASYAKEADGKPLRIDGYFGYSDRDVASEYQARTGQTATGEVSDADLSKLGVLALPPPKLRHLGIVFRGTGGIVGQDYVSRVCQGAGDLVEEVNPDWPASMGGLPPGAPGTPSMNKAVQIAIESGSREIRSGRTFVLGGYSAGAIVASRLRTMLEPGQALAQYRPNFVCGFTFGNPSRAFGHTYYLGAIPNGQGISTFHMPAATLGWDWADMAHPDDFYTNIPPGDTWDICSDVYAYVTDLALDDPLGLITRMLPMILSVLEDAGITLPFIGGALGSITNPAALVGLMLPMLISMLPGLIGGIGGGGGQLTGPAAAVQAAILGLKFLFAGTGPHISYHVNEVWPGQTYLGLAIQHVRDWSARTPVH
jgi:hypothetical protein